MAHADTTSGITEDQLTTWLIRLGVENPVVTEEDIAFFNAPYQPDARSYHDAQHQQNMANTELSDALKAKLAPVDAELAAAMRGIVGHGHDLVYMQVDYGQPETDAGIHQQVWKRLRQPDSAEPVAGQASDASLLRVNRFDDFHISIPEAHRNDAIIQLVATLFGVGDDGIARKDGANEFASALAVAKFLESKAVPIAHIAGITQMIAGTIPFRADERTDTVPHNEGYMGVLADRLTQALQKAGESETPEFVQAMTFLTVDTANRDVESFWKAGDAQLAAFITGGLKLDREANPHLREGKHSIAEMLAATGPGFYGRILAGEIAGLPENIAHSYQGFTGQTDADGAPLSQPQLVAAATARLQVATDYLKAKKVGVAVVAAVAAMADEPDASLTTYAPYQSFAAKLPEDIVKAHPDADIVLKLLDSRGEGMGVPGYTITESPTAAVVYRAAGKEQTLQLYEQIKDTTSFDAKSAEAFLQAVGQAVGGVALNIVLQELLAIQQSRAARVDTLKHQLVTLSSLSGAHAEQSAAAETSAPGVTS